MSKQFPKRRNSVQKMPVNETCSSGDPFLTSKLTKLSRPPRKMIQNFMTTEHEYDESYRDMEESEPQIIYNTYNKPGDNSRQLKLKAKKKNIPNIDNQYSDQQNQQQQISTYNNNNHHQAHLRPHRQKFQETKDIQERLLQIESIMGLQNENLRQQKQYLMRTIFKLQQKQKQYKSSLSEYRQRTIQLEQQNHLLREKYQKARQFITNGIGKMEEVIAKQPIETPASASIANLNTVFQGYSNQNSVNVTQNIDQLNDKFDALMYQYQKTRQPQLRKQCMEIAKQLKKLRKLQESTKKT